MVLMTEILSHVMQGEGDLIVHVGKLGYHVSHVQVRFILSYSFHFRSRVVVAISYQGVTFVKETEDFQTFINGPHLVINIFTTMMNDKLKNVFFNFFVDYIIYRTSEQKR